MNFTVEITFIYTKLYKLHVMISMSLGMLKSWKINSLSGPFTLEHHQAGTDISTCPGK